MTSEENGKKLIAPEVCSSTHGLDSLKEYDIGKLLPKVKIPKSVANEINEFLPDNKALCIGSWNDDSFTNTTNDWIDNHFETFLKAVLYGYEIEQEERFLLPLEKTRKSNFKAYATYQEDEGIWEVSYIEFGNFILSESTVTQAQIDNAPEWVRVVAKNKVKVSDDNE